MFNRVIVPLDGSPQSELILPLVANWSRHGNTEFVLLALLADATRTTPMATVSAAVLSPNASTEMFETALARDDETHQLRVNRTEAYLQHVANGWFPMLARVCTVSASGILWAQSWRLRDPTTLTPSPWRRIGMTARRCPELRNASSSLRRSLLSPWLHRPDTGHQASTASGCGVGTRLVCTASATALVRFATLSFDKILLT